MSKEKFLKVAGGIMIVLGLVILGHELSVDQKSTSSLLSITFLILMGAYFFLQNPKQSNVRKTSRIAEFSQTKVPYFCYQ